MLSDKFGVCDLVKITGGDHCGKYGIVMSSPAKGIMFPGIVAKVKLVKRLPEWYDRKSVYNYSYINVNDMRVVNKRWKKKAKRIWNDHRQKFASIAYTWLLFSAATSTLPLVASWIVGILMVALSVSILKIIYDMI